MITTIISFRHMTLNTNVENLAPHSPSGVEVVTNMSRNNVDYYILIPLPRLRRTKVDIKIKHMSSHPAQFHTYITVDTSMAFH